EHARWRDAGWVEGQPVWRFEAQIRGEAATELNLRATRILEESLDPAWQYVTRKWLRLVDLGEATRRERAPVDPRWQLLQGVAFVHENVAPAVRQRRSRGGADAPQLLGTAVSYLARDGELAEIIRQDGPTDTWDVARVERALTRSLRRALYQQFTRKDRHEWFDAFRLGMAGKAAEMATMDDELLKAEVTAAAPAA
ncbi:MAG: hypothetical protein EB084_20400, partial [Proteobacteria bacterium]|nr:hypothetical protein [Pseudomonadota bacterium]